MGLAKQMYVVGAFDFYTTNYADFAAIIGQRLGVNLEVIFSNWSVSDNEKPNELFDFDFDKTYIIQLEWYEADSINQIMDTIYYKYIIEIPVEFEDEKKIEIEFLSNGIFNILWLPFNHHWRFFIEDIIGDNDGYYKNHNEAIANIIAVRNFYKKTIKSLNCDSEINSERVLIWADAQYATERRFIDNPIPNRKNTIAQLADALRDLDKVKIYNFVGVLAQKITIKSERVHYLDIVFIDFLDQ